MSSKIKCKLLDPPYMTESPTKTRFEEMNKVIFPLFDSLEDYLVNVQDKCPTICQKLSDYIVDSKIEAKNAGISVKLREEGNAYFKSNDLENALERYTMSIAFAPAGSLELAMAYANRSAVLFKAKWMFDCLADINRALQHGYPDNLKVKLFLRKASCHQALNPKKLGPIGEAFSEAHCWLEKVDEKKKASMKKMLEEQETLKPTEKTICNRFDFDLPLPKLKNKNPTIPGLSDAVQMQYSQEFGRHCVATRDIKPGEVIGVQKPYINVLFMKWRYKFCWHCGKQTWSSIPCNGCAEVVYCSIKCRGNAQQEYHDVECYVIRRVLAFGVDDDFVTALRLTIKALKESKNSLATVSNEMNKLDAVTDPMEKGFIDGKLDPKNYSSVSCLDKPKYQNYEDAISNLVQSILIAYFLSKKMKLVSSWQSDLNDLKKDELFLFLIQFIANNDRLKVCNSYAVYLDTIDPQKSHKISNAITPCFAFFNHSCVHMTNFLFQNEQLVMSAIVPIKKNEQIFINHGIVYITHDKSKRDLVLSKMGIKCQCKACVYNWPKVDGVSNINPSDIMLSGNDLITLYTTHLDSASAHKSVYQYARENNRIPDYSKKRTSFSKMVEKMCRDSEMNSVKVIMAVTYLEIYINLAQRPFLDLN